MFDLFPYSTSMKKKNTLMLIGTLMKQDIFAASGLLKKNSWSSNFAIFVEC